MFIASIFQKISMFLSSRWVGGRQGGSYMKFLIFQSERFKFDMYLLKYPKGSYIKEHKDPVKKGYEHHRVNIVLNKDFRGGKFVIMGKAQKGRIHKFRPDIYRHRVREIKEGTRYVLSIGWLKRSK